MTGMVDRLRRCRSRGVPLVSVATVDDHATAESIAGALPQTDPIVAWTLAGGWRPWTESGAAAIPRMMDGADPYDPPHVGALRAASKSPDGTCAIMIGAHHWQGKPDAEAWIKAIRDPFESTGRTLVLLGPAFGSWGADVAPHVEELDDGPPDDTSRETAIRSVYRDANAPDPSAETIRLAVSGTRGLPAFGVKQASALAMEPSGLDLGALRARWQKQINATPGLSVDDTPRRMEDLGGLESIKAFGRRLSGSRRPPSAIVLMDEGGKMLAGGQGDTSGVSQGIEAALLTEMQDTAADGLIAFGIPGAGKSASAQALAAALAVPVVRFDLGACKGSLVGQSEANTRRALATIRALVGGRAFWIMTCNETATIKAELRRRFRSGIWFYDLPTAEERETIRRLYSAKHQVSVDPIDWPDLDGWTGAEIETAAERAADWTCTPREAAAWVVPVSQSSAETIQGMRTAAAGRYLSASYPGPYRGPQAATQLATGRKFAAPGKV